MTDATGARLELSRAQILGHRRRVGALDRRLPMSAESLRQAASAGLSDSMPRAATLSIHARVSGTEAASWEDPTFVQIWGPRFSAYVVALADLPVFTLGRLPEDDAGLRRAEDLADRLRTHLDGRRVPYGEAGRAIGVHPNALRYAAPTGTVLIRWEGARQPTLWTVPRPNVDPRDARLELARRYLRVFGPGAPAAFAEWAGIRPPRGRSAFAALGGSLTPVSTPIGDRWILAEDEASFSAAPERASGVRLLPSGDTFYLLQGADRELLVPDEPHRRALWTSRVWPGAILVGGEIAGTWRRANAELTVEPWRRLSAAERQAVEAEAASLPLPGPTGPIRVHWVE